MCGYFVVYSSLSDYTPISQMEIGAKVVFVVFLMLAASSDVSGSSSDIEVTLSVMHHTR